MESVKQNQNKQCRVCFNDTFVIRQPRLHRRFKIYCSKCEVEQSRLPVKIQDMENNPEGVEL